MFPMRPHKFRRMARDGLGIGESRRSVVEAPRLGDLGEEAAKEGKDIGGDDQTAGAGTIYADQIRTQIGSTWSTSHAVP